MHLKRFLPFFVAVISWLLAQGYAVRPEFIYAAVLSADIFIVLAVWRMTRDSLIDRHWGNYVILPILFFDGLTAYSAVLPIKNDFILLQSLFLLNALFLYFYLRSVYYHLVVPTAERQSNLENIFSFGNFAVFFFIISTIYGLQSFLNTPIWPLVLMIGTVSALLIYQTVWIIKSDIKKNAAYIVICSLTVSEVAWSLFLLPFNFNITGAILAVDYYVLSGILKAHLSGGLDKKTLKLYLIPGFAAIVILLVTARWL